MISEQRIREILLGDNISSKATTADYTNASISIVNGYGVNGAKMPPFNYKRALTKFNGWVYAAANANGAVTNYNTGAGDDTDDGDRLPNVSTVVGRVVKGASATKCSANIANTTLYPIRIKLLI